MNQDILEKNLKQRQNYTKNAQELIMRDRQISVMKDSKELILEDKPTKMELAKKSIQEFKEYKQTIKDLHKSKLGKTPIEINEIDKEIEKLRLNRQVNRIEREKERLQKTQDNILKSQMEEKEIKKSMNNFTNNTKQFKKNIGSKYENLLDKKIRELDNDLKTNETDKFDSGDLVQLLILGNLKVFMDGLKLAENLGVVITKKYIEDNYKDSLMSAEKIELAFNELKELDNQREYLIDKGIVIDNPSSESKELEIFDISKDIDKELLEKLEDSEEIKKIIERYSDLELKVDSTLNDVVKDYQQEIKSESFREQEKERKHKDEDTHENLHRV